MEAVLYLVWLGRRRDGLVRRDDDRPRAGLHDQPVGAQRLPVRRVPARGAGRRPTPTSGPRATSATRLGALLAGIALATNSDDVIRLVPVITAALLLLNALLVSRLPRRGRTSSTEAPLEALVHAGRPRERAEEPRLPADVDLRRRTRHPPGPAQRRHPAVAGRGDRRPTGAAGLAVRHQHRDGGGPPGRGGARASSPSPTRCAPSAAARSSSCSPAGSWRSPTTPSAGSRSRWCGSATSP